VATIDQKNLPKIGKITDARVVQDDDDVTMISSSGIVLRLKVKVISVSGRATRGFKVMDLVKDSIVASVARMAAKDMAARVEPTKGAQLIFQQPDLLTVDEADVEEEPDNMEDQEE
jgi:DNA gyrase subunit A